MKKSINLDELSNEELEALLKQRKAAEAQERAEQREAYEAERETLIADLLDESRQISAALRLFKGNARTQLLAFYERMKEYGDLRKTEQQKGSFQIVSKCGTMKVVFKNHTRKGFDERSKAACTHMNEFLKTKVKKKDKTVYELVSAILQSNDAGNLDIQLVSRLYKIEDHFDDADWLTAIKLFKESYVEQGTAYYINFYFLNADTNKFDLVQMDFASL